MLNPRFALVLATLTPFALAAGQQTQPAARLDVPVQSVVLFSSGVGYFEHAGSVRGDGSTELRFNTGQINDILKSLVLQDLDGGKITNITYPSRDPLARALRSFQVDITSNPSLSSLLNQLRGAKVTVQAQAEKLSGTIIGVETRRKAMEQGQPVDVPILNLLTGAMIRAIDLQAVSSLSLDDPQLQDELTKALTALSQARDQDKKAVTINFTGSGQRRVKIGYVVETPVWKTSYRLLLDDKNAHLQGWAIVENQTESDWNGVSLSLVSGRPISFVMDLYQPLYATRPTVVQELFAGLSPQVYDGGIAPAQGRVDMVSPTVQGGVGAAGGGGRGGRGGGGGGVGAGAGAPALAREEALSSLAGKVAGMSAAQAVAASASSVATTAQLGELFQYTIGNVTLARQKSAMLPIVTDSVSVERVSIYNASVLPKNPLTGVRLNNTTGKHLLQGPITVLEKNSYAGDAQIDNVPPGQNRLLSYGIDLEMLVDNTKNTQTSSVVTAKINKGVLVVSRRFVSSQEYLADNKSDHDKMLVIEHPVRQGWQLVDTQKPIETTLALYRFQGNAAAKKTTVLTVKEETVRAEGIAMLTSDTAQLLLYSRTGEIPKDVRDAIAKAIQLKQAVLEMERQIADRTRQITEITQEQDRIRENMKTVGQTTTYYDRLLAKLNEQESAIEKLQKERDAFMTQRDAKRVELSDYLSNLTVG